MTPHPDCEPQHHCRGCGKPVLCGEDIVVPWRSGRRYVVRHADRDGPTGWRRVYHCSTACYWRQLRARRREERSRSVICESCGGTFQAPRRGARYCSGSCRQDAYRRRRGSGLIPARCHTARPGCVIPAAVGLAAGTGFLYVRL